MRYLAPSIIISLAIVSTIPFVLSYEYWDSDFTVPSWIKNNAGWWADDQINDDSFVSGIQWMITNDVIILPPTELGTGDSENVIPRWVKSTAGWWSNDEINDATFVAALRYLIGEGIIIIEQEVEETSTDIEEIVEMKEFDFVVNDHSCALCTNWGYTGTEYYFQIKTFDEHHGSPIDGVTINAKIISKGGELRHDFGALTTEDGIYNGNITIPGGTEWFGENILFITAEYYGVEKTIEKEFDVFIQKRDSNECESENPFDLSGWETLPTGITFESGGSKMFVVGSTGDDVNEYTMQPLWCIGNAQFMDSFSVSGQETSPQSLAFSTDGTKMFIVGLTSKEVHEYTLGTAFDVSTATYVDEKSVDQGTNYDKPRAIDFSSDGTKMRILWSDKDAVGEYTCTTGFDVSTCSYTSSEPMDISSQETGPEAIAFNTDGTKMFIAGREAGEVNEYTCSTGFDLSTCSVVSGGEKTIDEDDTPRGIAFNTDGTKMFILGDDDNDVYEYACSTGFDVSSCSYSGDGERLQIQSQTNTPLGMAFNDDGTRLFIVSNADDAVFEYACTAFDVGSCTVDSGDPFSVSSEEDVPRGIAFNDNGSKMFIVGKTGDDVNEYSCTQFFDVSTCTVDSGDPFSVSSDDSAPSGIAFNTDGTKMFVLGATGDDVNEYACSTGFDVSTCGSVADKDISGQEANALAMAFNSDGTKMFIGGFAGDDVNEYTLSTAYDVSTATFVDAFSILTHEGKITGLAFDTNGHRMFIVGQGGVEMNEYYLTVAWDVSTASHK